MTRPARNPWLIPLIAYWIALSVGSHWPRLDFSALTGLDQNALPLGLDKWIHVLGYSGLSFLATLANLCGPGRRGFLLRAPLLLLYAGIDEITQVFSPGREVGWGDLAASSAGLGGGMLAWWVLLWLFDHDDSFMAHTRVVSAMTLLSRFFGLGRDILLARVFGFTGVRGAWSIAFQLPNLSRRLFGEGAMAASFLPQYTRLVEQDKLLADRFLRRVTFWIGTRLSMLVGLGMLLCIGLLYTDWLGERGIIAAKISLLTLWYAPMVCIVAIIGAALQVHHRFAVPSASPILMNVFMIAAILLAGHAMPAQATDLQRITLVAVSLLLSGVAQWIWHKAMMPPVEDEEETPALAAERAGRIDAAMKSMLAQWLPMTIGIAVFQINAFVDTLIAANLSSVDSTHFQFLGWSIAYPMTEKSLPALDAAQRVYEFPLGVFGVAVATTIFPQLARSTELPEQFARILRQGLRLTVFIGLPASAGLVLVALPLCKSLFYHGGSIKPEDAGEVATVLVGFATAIWAYSMNQVLTRAFYAHHNSLLPMRISMAMVALNLVGNLTLIWPLGAAGLAWSTAICAMLQCGVMLWCVRRYCPKPVDASVVRSWLHTAGLTIMMAVPVHFLIVNSHVNTLRWTQVVGLLSGCATLGIAIVLIGAKLLKMEELRWLLGRGK